LVLAVAGIYAGLPGAATAAGAMAAGYALEVLYLWLTMRAFVSDRRWPVQSGEV
jgi:hypothetical protein